MPPADELARTLARLYAEQLALSPHDRYLREHADPRVIETQVKVFRWYVPLLGDCLAPNARVMDWGCRHAPDTCLLRASFGHSHCLSATDLEPPGRFSVFHQYAGLEYRPLDCVFRLPFPDASPASVQWLDPTSMLALHRRLLDVRRASPALHEGELALLDAPAGILRYARTAGEDHRQVLVNFGALSVCVISSILPALRAARLHPVQALRFE